MIKDTRCLVLRRLLQEDTVVSMDPEEDIPSGMEVIGEITQEKKLSQAAVDIIVTLFDHTSEAHAHMSSAVANISALAKLVDPETFKVILRVSVHPMVQLTIPERFLDLIHNPDVDMSRSTTLQKIEWDLLLIPTRPCLVKEPDNSPTCLLCAAVWLKLSKVFLNKGTQEVAGLFRV